MCVRSDEEEGDRGEDTDEDQSKTDTRIAGGGRQEPNRVLRSGGGLLGLLGLLGLFVGAHCG